MSDEETTPKPEAKPDPPSLAVAQSASTDSIPAAPVMESPSVPEPAAPTIAEGFSPLKNPQSLPSAQGHRNEDSAALLEQLRDEIRAAQQSRSELESLRARAIDRDRIMHLRKSGAVDVLTDAHLLALAPDADPGTAEGRAKLNEWRESNKQLFEAKPMSGKMVTEEMIAGIKESKHGTFGKKLAAKLAADLMKGG